MSDQSEAAVTGEKCPLCGYAGLLPVERCDGRPIWATYPKAGRQPVRSVVATCNCPHGERVRAGHGGSAPWPQLIELVPQCRPVGGWPEGFEAEVADPVILTF